MNIQSSIFSASWRIQSRRRAFTLIELLVVIAIIAILTAIILPNIVGSEAKARDAQRVSDLGQIQLALAMYFDRCGQYPDTTSSPGNQYQFVVSTASSCTSNGQTYTINTFISQIPTPPGANGTGYDYAVERDSSSPYKVVNYVLHAGLESNSPALAKSLSRSTVATEYSQAPQNWTWYPAPYVFGCYDPAYPDSYSYCLGPN